MMKKILLIIILLLVYLGVGRDKVALFNGLNGDVSDNAAIQRAYQERDSDVQVQGFGRVIKTLSDDLDGSRHQRFIVKTDSGQTILIAHNIDLADKIVTLKQGDQVEFYGEYKWNEKGGVLHWTHHDPQNRHAHGWIKHKGIKYQ